MNAPASIEPGTIALQAYTLDALEFIAVEFLKRNGYHVEKWRPWETPGQICRRLKISHPTFKRRIDSPACPAVNIERKSGKIVHISSTSLLDEFLISGKDTSEF